MAIHTVDDYLESLPEAIREALQRIRDIVRKTVPEAKERIAYQIPVFSLHQDLVGFASQKDHCSFYTMSPPLTKRMAEELRKYKVSGATIHFTPEKPLPEALIKKILRERVKEQRQS